MTSSLRKKIEDAAFWEGLVCLRCDETCTPDQVEDGSCPSCGRDTLIPAKRLDNFLTRLESNEG